MELNCLRSVNFDVTLEAAEIEIRISLAGCLIICYFIKGNIKVQSSSCDKT